MTLDVTAVLSCTGNPVDAFVRKSWGGIGFHMDRYKDGTRATGQETSVAAGSHTHTHTQGCRCWATLSVSITLWQRCKVTLRRDTHTQMQTPTGTYIHPPMHR